MTREIILVGVVCLLCIAWVARQKRLQERRAQVVAADARGLSGMPRGNPGRRGRGHGAAGGAAVE